MLGTSSHGSTNNCLSCKDLWLAGDTGQDSKVCDFVPYLGTNLVSGRRHQPPWAEMKEVITCECVCITSCAPQTHPLSVLPDLEKKAWVFQLKFEFLFLNGYCFRVCQIFTIHQYSKKYSLPPSNSSLTGCLVFYQTPPHRGDTQIQPCDCTWGKLHYKNL